MAYARTAAGLALWFASTSLGQSINIDFGTPDDVPPPTYAAAGLAGVWNGVEGQHTSIGNPQFTYDLVDLDGNPTGAYLHQFGGMELVDESDASVTGDHEALMNDAIITHQLNLETCVYIQNLQPGTYEVITYGWRPNHPEIVSRIRYDNTAGIFDLGGVWPGQHVEGVTYSRHILEVPTGPLGDIGGHSGNVQGNDLLIGAAMNGMQLRLLEDCPSPAIVNGQTGVSFSDAAFNDYIDPRAESTDGVHQDLGLDAITIVFNTAMRDAGGADLTTASFSIAHTGAGDPPSITGIETEDDTNVTLLLDAPIEVAQWTTVSTSAVSACGGESIAGQSEIRVGFLPADVDQSADVTPFDLLRFRQMVNGQFQVTQGVDLDYVDTDRNGAIQPFDLLRYRQAINGTPPSTHSWAGAALP